MKYYLSFILIVILVSLAFNQTKQMEDEGRLLEFCYHNTTIKIPDLDKFCGLRYGGLEGNYGDKIK